MLRTSLRTGLHVRGGCYEFVFLSSNAQDFIEEVSTVPMICRPSPIPEQ